MTPRDEPAIERYIRYPYTLGQGQRQEVEHLLLTDPVARRVANFYRSFYDELDLQPEAATSAPGTFPADDVAH